MHESVSMTQLSPALARKIASTIAGEIGAQPAQVQAAVGLLDETTQAIKRLEERGETDG